MTGQDHINILHVASEVAPFSKTGGLGDVVGALPRALLLAQAGRRPQVRTYVVSGRYGSLDPSHFNLARRLRKIPVPVGTHTFEIEVYEGKLPDGGADVPVYFVEHPLLSGRPGVYGPPDQPAVAYDDNALRFALLGASALSIARTFDLRPDVVHGHDWQGALALYYSRRGYLFHGAQGAHRAHRRPATVLTLHNLSFLGLAPFDQVAALGVDPALFTPEGIEFYGQASLLKAGLLHADRITAVSPRYAREIQTAEGGCGLDGLLRHLSVRLVGILNGADYDRWSPWLDPYLPMRYGKPLSEKDAAEPALVEAHLADIVVGKARAKTELQRELGMTVRPTVPLCATISRLTDQKGIELILQVLESGEALRGESQYVLVGSGERGYEDRLRALRSRHPGRIGLFLGYDEALSHRVEAAADIYIMPSLFEPCGLNQMYSLRYGTVPVVRAVGGLDDTVVDYDSRSRSGTGFKFSTYDAGALAHAWNRAVSAYHGDEGAWHALMRRGMRADYSWTASARAYLSVYQQALVDSHTRG